MTDAKKKLDEFDDLMAKAPEIRKALVRKVESEQSSEHHERMKKFARGGTSTEEVQIPEVLLKGKKPAKLGTLARLNEDGREHDSTGGLRRVFGGN
jgi:hypothetical protein